MISFWRKLWCLSAKTSAFTFSLTYCKLVILGTLDIPGYAHLKKIVSTYRELLCLTSKKSTLPPCFPEDIAKICIYTFYFGYFGYVLLRKPKIIVKNLISICMPKINFTIHFFFGILHFKDSCSLIGQQHFDP